MSDPALDVPLPHDTQPSYEDATEFAGHIQDQLDVEPCGDVPPLPQGTHDDAYREKEFAGQPQSDEDMDPARLVALAWHARHPLTESKYVFAGHEQVPPPPAAAVPPRPHATQPLEVRNVSVAQEQAA